MEYREIIHYAALLLIPITLAEIYVRQKGLCEREGKMRDGSKLVTDWRNTMPPIGLLIVSIIVAVLTIPKWVPGSARTRRKATAAPRFARAVLPTESTGPK